MARNSNTIDESGSVRKPITMQDIARVVGVSKMAVSYAFSDKSHAVSPATREAILRAAKEMGFEPNPHARRLSKGGCSTTIGLLALGLDRGVNTLKLQAIQRHLSGHGFDVPIYSSNMHADAESANAGLLRSLCAQRPRAIICNIEALHADTAEDLSRFETAGGSILTYDRPSVFPYDHVQFDRRDNTYQAAYHLLQQGHRRIGLFAPGYGVSDLLQSERFQGFQDALQEFGASPQEDLLFVSQDIPERSGAFVAQKILQMPDQHRPTALCIVNDAAATSCIAQLVRNGIKVPDDISVVGHDDLPEATYSWLPLTTVSHPVNAIAKQVVDLILSRLDGSYVGPPRIRTVRGELIVRESTQEPKA
jgi:LacI family transcriptional regulator